MATDETCLSDIMGCWAPDLEGKRMKPPKLKCALAGRGPRLSVACWF